MSVSLYYIFNIRSIIKFVFSNEFLTPGGVGLYIDKNISFTIQDDLNLLCNKCENV